MTLASFQPVPSRVCAASDTTYVLGALRHNLMCAASGNVLPRRTTLEPRASLRLVDRHRLAASTYVSTVAQPRASTVLTLVSRAVCILLTHKSPLPLHAQPPPLLGQWGPTFLATGTCNPCGVIFGHSPGVARWFSVLAAMGTRVAGGTSMCLDLR